MADALLGAEMMTDYHKRAQTAGGAAFGLYAFGMHHLHMAPRISLRTNSAGVGIYDVTIYWRGYTKTGAVRKRPSFYMCKPNSSIIHLATEFVNKVTQLTYDNEVAP